MKHEISGNLIYAPQPKFYSDTEIPLWHSTVMYLKHISKPLGDIINETNFDVDLYISKTGFKYSCH